MIMIRIIQQTTSTLRIPVGEMILGVNIII